MINNKYAKMHSRFFINSKRKCLNSVNILNCQQNNRKYIELLSNKKKLSKTVKRQEKDR